MTRSLTPNASRCRDGRFNSQKSLHNNSHLFLKFFLLIISLTRKFVPRLSAFNHVHQDGVVELVMNLGGQPYSLGVSSIDRSSIKGT